MVDISYSQLTVTESDMGYILNNLTDREKVIYQTGLSTIIFLPCLFLAALVVMAYLGTKDLESGTLIMRAVWTLCFLKTLSSIITFYTSEFGITNKRVLGKTGCVNVESLDIVLSKVEAIRVNRGFLGFLFGFGDIEVTGTGGTHEVLKNIPAPMQFRKRLQEQIDTTVDNSEKALRPKLRMVG